MTDPWTVTVAVLTLALAVVIAWRLVPRPPDLEGERWFKAWLATLLRGRFEARGASPEDWATAVDQLVLFHPAGRWPERKLVAPSIAHEPALEGERALVEALARLPDADARWEHLYVREERGRASRLGDPHDLGASHRPERWLGSALTWDAVADAAQDPEGAMCALAAASPARWVLVPGAPLGAPELLTALTDLLGERAIVHDAVDPTPEGLAAFRGAMAAFRPGAPAHIEASVALLEHLHALAPRPADRLVVVASGASIHHVLDALLVSDALRDQIDAVVSVGGAIGGLDGAEHPLDPSACERFLRENFTHQALDLEAARLCPYFAMQWMTPGHDSPGAFGLPVERARFPQPADHDGPRPFIEPVDLGPLHPGPALPLDLVALALCGVVTGWVRARRP